MSKIDYKTKDSKGTEFDCPCCGTICRYDELDNTWVCDKCNEELSKICLHVLIRKGCFNLCDFKEKSINIHFSIRGTKEKSYLNLDWEYPKYEYLLRYNKEEKSPLEFFNEIKDECEYRDKNFIFSTELTRLKEFNKVLEQYEEWIKRNWEFSRLNYLKVKKDKINTEILNLEKKFGYYLSNRVPLKFDEMTLEGKIKYLFDVSSNKKMLLEDILKIIKLYNLTLPNSNKR